MSGTGSRTGQLHVEGGAHLTLDAQVAAFLAQVAPFLLQPGLGLC